MKKFIRVQSNINIDVTPGLLYVDMTNEDAHVPDRFRVASAWVQSRIAIREGAHLYPAVIQNWGSVKSLVKSGKLTLGTETDEGDDTAQEMYDRLDREEKKYRERTAAAKADQIRSAKSGAASSARRIAKLEEPEAEG